MHLNQGCYTIYGFYDICIRYKQALHVITSEHFSTHFTGNECRTSQCEIRFRIKGIENLTTFMTYESLMFVMVRWTSRKNVFYFNDV